MTKTPIDIFCSSIGFSGAACVEIVSTLPIWQQLFSIILVLISIAWFIYRWKKDRQHG